MNTPELPRPDHGFTLAEVLTAMLVISVAAVAAADLFNLAVRSIRSARYQTSAVLLAEDKLEQLNALTWEFASVGSWNGVSDSTTDLSRHPAVASGRGLLPSPAGTLDRDTPGYVDFLDAAGRWVGTGSAPPASAVFIRRWSVTPAATGGDTIVFRVLVTTVQRERSVGGASGPRLAHGDDVLVTAVRTRRDPG